MPRNSAQTAGFSLVELMIALAIVGLFLGGVYGLFINFLGEAGEQAALSKRGLDQRVGLRLMRRDLASAGFGVAATDMAGAVAGGATTVRVRSTDAHGHDNAGRHGILNGSPGSQSAAGLAGSIYGVALSPARELVASGELANLDAAPRNLFFAANPDGAGDLGNPYAPEPYYIERAYELSSDCSGAGCGECATGTPDLQYDDTNGGIEPVVDCVLDLQVRYGFQQSGGGVTYSHDPATPPALAVDATPDLLKLGVVVQAGQRMRGRTMTETPVRYDDADLRVDNLGNVIDVDLTATQQEYRWQVVEMTVPLENLQ